MDLAPEMMELLRAGAEHDIGVICLPGQVQKNWALLREAERMKLIVFQGHQPIITDVGRLAIGAPMQIEADYARFRAAFGRRKRLKPTPDKDPRTDFDYRSYKSLGYVCVLAVRLPDNRYQPTSLLVGKSLDDPKAQGLTARNSILLPECEGTPFALAVMPRWLVDRVGFSVCPFPLDEHDHRWSDDDRATWSRLRDVCISCNSRIRSAGRKTPTAKLQYGQYA